MRFFRTWYPRWETGGGSGECDSSPAPLCMLRCRSMVSPADTKAMLRGRSMTSRVEGVGWSSPKWMLRDVSMVSYAGTKDMLLGWSMASLMVDAGRFIPCMLRSRSMVDVIAHAM